MRQGKMAKKKKTKIKAAKSKKQSYWNKATGGRM
jgi:hypothetical protein